jgi:hypothetical protein
LWVIRLTAPMWVETGKQNESGTHEGRKQRRCPQINREQRRRMVAAVEQTHVTGSDKQARGPPTQATLNSKRALISAYTPSVYITYISTTVTCHDALFSVHALQQRHSMAQGDSYSSLSNSCSNNCCISCCNVNDHTTTVSQATEVTQPAPLQFTQTTGLRH